MNYLRDEKRHGAANYQLSFFETLAVEDTAEQEAIATIMYRHIYEEIAKLPENMQRVIQLSLNGLKNPEIAERLDITDKTVRNIKTEAIKRIRFALLNKELILADIFLIFLLDRCL